MIYTPAIQEMHANLQSTIAGTRVNYAKPKNAFKYPEADGACFPQHEILKPIDYRSQNLPMAQYAFRGNRRKYTGEELEYMKNLHKSQHPNMETLAGGGAILAKTGERISKKEALFAQPGVAAQVAQPDNSASAIAAAVTEEMPVDENSPAVASRPA